MKPKLILRIRSRPDGGLCNVWLLRTSGGWGAVKPGATVTQCLMWGVMQPANADQLAKELEGCALVEWEEWKVEMPAPVKVREAMDQPDALPL